ncbi:MAG TPA: enolase C-terminal domain-like protein [Acetobacteraceae bacterium]|nr:enolase C-terminal domain-like protein [Acetobacteraceae bacterium]
MSHPIRITDVSVFTVRIPVLAVHSHGIGDVGGAVANVLLKLGTDVGITGWGEASPWTVFTGSAEANAAALNHYLRPILQGADPFRIGALMHRADQAIVHCTEAKAAMEMALFDIVGQALGAPVCDLLGGRFRDEIPLSFSIANPDFDQDLELLPRLVADGIRLFKVKTGFLDHASDLRRLETLKARLPADAELRVDYNQGMEPYDAIRRLRDIEQFRPGFIEQPVRADKRAALGAITAALDTPIMADESVFSPADALMVAGQHLADLISVKLMKTGGMLRAREVAAIAAAGGLACYGGSMFETGISATAGAHFIAATPNMSLGCEFYQPTYYLECDLLAQPFAVRDGKVQVPDAPGLGISVDEDKVRRYTWAR